MSKNVDVELKLGVSPSFLDSRGQFSPLSLVDGQSSCVKWVQTNISISDKKDTFRGLHYQMGNSAQTKLIKCVRGKIIDIVVDLRETSPQYLQAQFFELHSGNHLLIPNYYAHGFLTLEDNCVVQYLVDAPYVKADERTLFWNAVSTVSDLLAGKNLIISDKDNPPL